MSRPFSSAIKETSKTPTKQKDFNKLESTVEAIATVKGNDKTDLKETTTQTLGPEDTTTINNRQELAIKKKRERQEIQGTYMKRLRSDTSRKADIGSIVAIKM